MKTEGLILVTWILLLLGWIIQLSANAALQSYCERPARGVGQLLGAAAGYLGSTSCSNFFGYTWWITWYTFLLLILVPILAFTRAISSFRAGLLALLALGVMLLGDTANTYLYYNSLPALDDTLSERARTMVAGAIISSIAIYLIIILAGIADEKGEKVEETGEPKGETYGGRFEPKAGTTGPYASPYTSPEETRYSYR